MLYKKKAEQVHCTWFSLLKKKKLLLKLCYLCVIKLYRCYYIGYTVVPV